MTYTVPNTTYKTPETTIKIVSWNTHYGFDEIKKSAILKENPDILVIQECKEQDCNFLSSDYAQVPWHCDKIESGNNPDHELGICIFYKKNLFKIDKTSYFEKLENCRYVLPYVISAITNNECVKLFTLCAVWTKGCDKKNAKYENYHTQIKNAFDVCPELQKEKNIMLIGDFNTGSVQNSENEKWFKSLAIFMSEKGYKNCAAKKEWLPTYFKGNGSWLDDHCYLKTDKINITSFEIGEKDSWIKPELSDHVPLIAEVAF